LGPQSKGVSVSQTAPNPYKSRTSVAVEYRKLLEQLDPKLKPDYIGLEGMISAKVLVEALKRSGPQPTREALLRSLNGMNDFDVGGYFLKFDLNNHHGSRYVDITWIGGEGRVVD
jgi:ABC-type branched-subunit amino acid transport system substrate-binding protein